MRPNVNRTIPPTTLRGLNQQERALRYASIFRTFSEAKRTPVASERRYRLPEVGRLNAPENMSCSASFLGVTSTSRRLTALLLPIQEWAPRPSHRATPLTISAVLYAPSPSIPNSSGIIVPSKGKVMRVPATMK